MTDRSMPDLHADPSERNETSPPSPNDRSEMYRSAYGTARKVSMFVSFLGWVVCVGGLLLALFGLISLLQVPSLDRQIQYGTQYGVIAYVYVGALIQGFIMAVFGLFLVASGQITRATVDNADHSREILILLQSKIG